MAGTNAHSESRQRSTKLRALASASLAIALFVTAAVLLRTGQPEAIVVADDATSQRALPLNGIVFDVPAGWTIVPPGCGMPPDKTVSVGSRRGSCPFAHDQPPTTAVHLTEVFGPQLFLSGRGTTIEWRGTDPGLVNEERRGDLHVVTLYLPRRNAAIEAQSPDLAIARGLALERAHPRDNTEDALDAADSVFIQSFAGTDGDGLDRSVTVTNPDDITALLGDLRSLPDLGRAPVCDTPWSPQSATITLTLGDRSRTFAARFDDCGQVVNGDGSVAAATSQLRAAVIRLVPNAGIDESAELYDTPRAPSCNLDLPGSGVRPTTIFFGCATSADYLSDINWSAWTATVATGTAMRNIDTCRRPDATEGLCGYVKHPVEVTLSNPGYVNRDFVFRTVTLRPTTSDTSSDATALFCGPVAAGRQDHCDVPTDSWGHAPE